MSFVNFGYFAFLSKQPNFEFTLEKFDKSNNFVLDQTVVFVFAKSWYSMNALHGTKRLNTQLKLK